jgi:DNA polymerase III alpha subunit
MREIKGLSEDDAKKIMSARGTGYDSVRDVWLRTGLAPRVLERLADADAFGSLGLSRRRALWAVKALGRAGDQDDLPLLLRNENAVVPAFPPPLRGRDREGGRRQAQEFGITPLPIPPPQGGREQVCASNDSSFSEPEVALPPMPLGEEVVNDYRFLRLSLRTHPAAFLRSALAARGIVTNETLRAKPSAARMCVSGLVTIRQRPGSANGVIFMTIEDETGIANIIVWPHAFERFRPVVLGARYVAVTGKMQQETGVIHVVADRLEDLSWMLGSLLQDGPPIEALARADEVKRSQSDPREKPTRTERQAGFRHPRNVAADLDVTAPGSAHAPTRKAGA